jgi:hypothetical protein
MRTGHGLSSRSKRVCCNVCQGGSQVSVQPDCAAGLRFVLLPASVLLCCSVPGAPPELILYDAEDNEVIWSWRGRGVQWVGGPKLQPGCRRCSRCGVVADKGDRCVQVGSMDRGGAAAATALSTASFRVSSNAAWGSSGCLK